MATVGRTDRAVYVDLGDATWRVVEVMAGGWRILEAGTAPVRFRRPDAMLPLPVPQVGGRLDELRRHVNLADDDGQWSLVAAFLVASVVLAPRGPFPILVLHGEQGTMKTSCTQACMGVIDPRRAGLRALSHDLETLAVASHNGFLLAFDNVSQIEPALSDGLCRLATGSGYAKRTHYENREESIFDAARPMLLNGIGNVVVKADLLDRAVAVELPFVPESRRRPKREVDRHFAEARPRILAGLLDAVSLAIAHSERLAAQLTALPRMANFFVAAVAAESAFGVPAGTFERAHTASRLVGAETAAEAEPFALAVRDFARRRGEWEGSASELHALLRRPQEVPRSHWPESASAVASRLVRAQPALRTFGVLAEKLPRSAKSRGWRIAVARHDAATATAVTGGTPEASPEFLSLAEGLGGADGHDAAPRPTSPAKGERACAGSEAAPC